MKAFPEGLEPHLAGHKVSTVKSEGWNSIKNGKLLDLIEKSRFELFITNDKRMENEQQLERRAFATLLLSNNHWPTMKLHVAKIAEASNSCEPGTVTKLECCRFVPSKFRRKPTS